MFCCLPFYRYNCTLCSSASAVAPAAPEPTAGAAWQRTSTTVRNLLKGTTGFCGRVLVEPDRIGFGPTVKRVPNRFRAGSERVPNGFRSIRSGEPESGSGRFVRPNPNRTGFSSARASVILKTNKGSVLWMTSNATGVWVCVGISALWARIPNQVVKTSKRAALRKSSKSIDAVSDLCGFRWHFCASGLSFEFLDLLVQHGMPMTVICLQRFGGP